MNPQQPVLQTLRDDSDDGHHQGRSPSRSSSAGGLSVMESARRSNANLRTIRDDKGGGGIKRVRSSDMLRMQIDMMQSESEEKERKVEADRAADKAKAESDLADQKRRHDADKDYLRSRINELRKRVADAEEARATSDARLTMSPTSRSADGEGGSGASGASNEEERRLRKAVDDAAVERKALEEKIAAMQADIDRSSSWRRGSVDVVREESYHVSNLSGGSPESAEIARLQKRLEDMTAAKKEADDAGKNLQEQLDQRAMADGTHQAAIDDATSKERRLRQKLRKLQDEMEVASFEKKVADEETQKQLKAEQDKNLEMEANRKATEENMRNKLQALQHEMELAVEEKEAAVQAKVAAEQELQRAISDSASGASDYAEQTAAVQKQLEDLRALKLVHDRAGAAKQRELEHELVRSQNKSKHDADAAQETKRKLEAQLAALQEAADEATYSKLANEDIRADLERRLKASQEEVERAQHEKHQANEELDRVKKEGGSGASQDSSETDELTAQLKAAQEQAAQLLREKEDRTVGSDSTESDREIADLREQLRQIKAAKKQAEDTASAKSSKDAADMAGVLAGLEKQLEEARQEKAAMKAKADSDHSAKVKAESDLTAAVSSDDKAALEELKRLLADATDAKALAESEFASLLRRSTDGSTVDDRIALLRKELYDSRVAGMAQKKASGAKEAQLEERLRAIRREMEAAESAKVEAERERDRARSETSGSMASDERSDKLRKKLDEMEAAKRAHDDRAAARERKLEADVQKVKESRQARIDEGEARERKLEDDLEALKAKLTTMQEDADNAAYAKLEGDAGFKRRLGEMKAEVDRAVFEKTQADSEVERLRGSSGSETSGSNSAEYEALAAKLRESEERVAALRAQKKTIQDDADAKKKVDRDDRDALQAVLDSLKLQLDESKGGRKAEVDELHEKLRSLRRRVESAEHAQVLAEKELDRAIEDGSGSSSNDRVAVLRKELYENRVASKAQKDAGAVREKELADQLVSIREEAEAAAKASEDEFLAKEGDLLKRVKFLQEEMEAAMEAQFEAEKERDRARSQSDAESGSMSSSDAQTITSLRKKLEELQALKKAADKQAAGRERKLAADRKEDRDAVAAREAKMEAKMATLKAQLQASEEAADEAAFAKTTTAGAHKAAMDAAGAREDELKKQLKEAVDQKHLADEKLERASSSDAASSTAEVTELEARLKKSEDEKKQFKDQAKQLRDAAERLEDEAGRLQEKAEEEKKWADESIERLQEELSLLQEQAAVLASGKRIAEEEIREMRIAAEAGGKGMTAEAADALLVQQVEQLKAEQQLSYNIAETMYRRLDADNQALQEELEAMENQKKEVDDELLNVREHELRDVYDKLHDEQTKGSELQIQVGALEAKLKEAESSPSNQEDLNHMKEQVDKLLRDLEHMTAEKEAATKRLEWEKATKRELRQKIYGLQEHADAASTAKKTLEEELRALQDQPEIQTTESMEELAEKLKQQVHSLQEEKEETLRKMQALEHSVATGEYEVGDSARVREAYVNKLQSDIELLETSLKHLTDENRVLWGSKERLEGEMSKGEKAKFCALDDQIQSLNSQTKDLTEKLDTARKEAGDAKIAQKEEKDQVLDLQYRMDKNILQLATLKSTTRTNMERIKKEHDEAVKSARESGAADAREELEEVRRERETLKAALEAETQGRKEDEQLRAAESTKNGAKDREIVDLKSYVEELMKKNKELEKEVACSLEREKFEKENKDSFSTSDEFVRMKVTFEKQVKELKEENKMKEEQMKELREKNEVLAMERESQASVVEGLQSQVREFSLAKQNGNKLHTVEERTVNGALGKEHEKKLVLESENATLKSSMMDSDLHMEEMRKEIMDLKNKDIQREEEMRSERREFEQQIQAMRSQVVERQNAGESGPGNGASPTDLVASAASCENIDPASNGRGNLRQGALAALKASRDHLVARLSRNLHNERDSLARRAQALKLSEVAAERAAESAALTSAGPSSVERSMRDMTHSQEEFESLQSILNRFKSLYEMKDLALKETQIERDELRIELQRYQARAIE